ncbi:hypothetical protein, partial [Sphingomonas sp. CCH16-B10]|uniref:hypothetical protein n=1 Tax=Sphingomonas sp. CCH16-B10 TaxID=1768755 RepID=UPI001E5A24C6
RSSAAAMRSRGVVCGSITAFAYRGSAGAGMGGDDPLAGRTIAEALTINSAVTRPCAGVALPDPA